MYVSAFKNFHLKRGISICLSSVKCIFYDFTRLPSLILIFLLQRIAIKWLRAFQATGIHKFQTLRGKTREERKGNEGIRNIFYVSQKILLETLGYGEIQREVYCNYKLRRTWRWINYKLNAA